MVHLLPCRECPTADMPENAVKYTDVLLLTSVCACDKNCVYSLALFFMAVSLQFNFKLFHGLRKDLGAYGKWHRFVTQKQDLPIRVSQFEYYLFLYCVVFVVSSFSSQLLTSLPVSLSRNQACTPALGC